MVTMNSQETWVSAFIETVGYPSWHFQVFGFGGSSFTDGGSTAIPSPQDAAAADTDDLEVPELEVVNRPGLLDPDTDDDMDGPPFLPDSYSEDTEDLSGLPDLIDPNAYDSEEETDDDTDFVELFTNMNMSHNPQDAALPGAATPGARGVITFQSYLARPAALAAYHPHSDNGSITSP